MRNTTILRKDIFIVCQRHSLLEKRTMTQLNHEKSVIATPDYFINILLNSYWFWRIFCFIFLCLACLFLIIIVVNIVSSVSNTTILLKGNFHGMPVTLTEWNIKSNVLGTERYVYKTSHWAISLIWWVFSNSYPFDSVSVEFSFLLKSCYCIHQRRSTIKNVCDKVKVKEITC